MKIKELKKERLLFSYNVFYHQHCPLDYLLEEAYALKKINILTLGTGECCFFSSKQPFDSEAINWSYTLQDQELVFGNLNELKNAFKLLNNHPYPTLVIITCIPSMMNLDIENLIQQYPKFILIQAPCFKLIHSMDILSDFYDQIFKNCTLTIENKISLIENKSYSYDEIISLLSSQTIIVQNIYFLKLLQSLKKRYPITMIDNTRIQELSFYFQYKDLLSIDEKKLIFIQKNLPKIDRTKKYAIQSKYATSLAYFLSKYHIFVDKLYLPYYSDYIYQELKKLNPEVEIFFYSSIETNVLSLQESDAKKPIDALYQFIEVITCH